MIIGKLKIDNVNPVNRLLVGKDAKMSYRQFEDPSPLLQNPVRLLKSADIGHITHKVRHILTLHNLSAFLHFQGDFIDSYQLSLRPNVVSVFVNRVGSS